MKIVSALFIAILALPLWISIGTSYIAGTKELIPYSDHAFIYFVSYSLRSEPAMMIFFGTVLIAIAGIGRKNLLNKDADHKNQQKLRPAMPPNPNPVPWKKDT
jgi:hypothetical protein